MQTFAICQIEIILYSRLNLKYNFYFYVPEILPIQFNVDILQ